MTDQDISLNRNSNAQQQNKSKDEQLNKKTNQSEMMGSRISNRQLVADRRDPPSPVLIGSERKRHMSDTALVSSRASCWTAAYESNDKQLKMFFLCERSGRRPAICSRIDKFYHNRQLVNYMEYLLREDYIRNFLL